jgi:N utilization substance protein A
VISRELRGEKIDIIEWSHDPATFVARALSPAKVSSVVVQEATDADAPPAALVVVADNQLSLAIGKKGQNARLAAKLTGMRIDIKSESEIEAERTPSTGRDQAGLGDLPEMSGTVVDALVAAGLASPLAIVEAGVERLRALPEIGERADKIYAAAEEWVAAHPSLSVREGSASASEADDVQMGVA